MRIPTTNPASAQACAHSVPPSSDPPRPWLKRISGVLPVPSGTDPGDGLAAQRRGAGAHRPSGDGLRAYLAQPGMLGLIGGTVLLLALWIALRQTTRPLQRLTASVRALGADLHAEDVRPEGSREIRTLVDAFNDMKDRIARLLEERPFILAGIAHDLRTYLTRRQLSVDFIEDGEQRARATRDVEQMSALLDDSLLFAILGQGQRRESELVDSQS